MLKKLGLCLLASVAFAAPSIAQTYKVGISAEP